MPEGGGGGLMGHAGQASSYRPHRRHFSAPVVLCICVASFMGGRYLDLFLEFGQLPDPSASHVKILEVALPEDRASHAVRRDSAPLPVSAGGESQQQTAPRDILLEMEPTVHGVMPVEKRMAHQDGGVDLGLTDGGTVQQQDVERVANDFLLADLPPLEPTDSGSPEYRTIPFQVLSWYPRIVLFPKFLDEDKCDHVVEIGKARLGSSGLVLRKGEDMKTMTDIRTSSGTFLSRGIDPDGVLGEVEDRISAWTSIPVKHGEPFNLLRYELGQHYDSHYDVFDETYGPQASQRMATVLVYLSHVEEGGETVFPLEGRDGLARLQGINYKRCDLGFKYKPRKGDALLFYSTHPNGKIDKHSLHGGCPVVSGEKWVMTKWLRDKCFGSC